MKARDTDAVNEILKELLPIASRYAMRVTGRSTDYGWELRLTGTNDGETATVLASISEVFAADHAALVVVLRHVLKSAVVQLETALDKAPLYRLEAPLIKLLKSLLGKSIERN